MKRAMMKRAMNSAEMVRAAQRARQQRRAIAQLRRMNAQQQGLGFVTFTGTGRTVVTVLTVASLLAIGYGIYKLGRYVVTGSFGPKYRGSGVPHAREVFG